MSKLRVGVIGLGEVAQVIHLPVLRSLPDLYQVCAVCDISPTLRSVVGDTYGVDRRYERAAEMVAAEDLDCVLVLNSDEYHAESVTAALDHGVQVLVEKPMCLNRREAEEIIAARDRSGRTVMVGYMRRFAPALLEAKEQIAELGPINYVRVHDVIGRNQLIVDQTSLVHRPSDVPAYLATERRDRGARLVREALGETPDELVALIGCCAVSAATTSRRCESSSGAREPSPQPACGRAAGSSPHCSTTRTTSSHSR